MGAGALSLSAVDNRVPALVERLRRVHRLMVDAALVGDGFDRMAELAAEQAARPVAIVVPALEVAVLWPGASSGELQQVERFTAARVGGKRAEIPSEVDLLVPVTYGDELIGSVAMLGGAAPAAPEASEFLHLAATTSATAYALEEARDREAASRDRVVLGDLLAGRIDGRVAARRASAAGCDLSAGLVVSATEIRSSRPREAVSVVGTECPGAVAELVDRRLYALLPAAAPSAQLAERLRTYGPTAISSSYVDAKDIGRALREAELMLDVVARDAQTARAIEDAGHSDVYRLLFRVLASRPEEVLSFYEDTIAPIARYDVQYHGELVPTLEAYLGNDCNMNATARAIFAHRHTIAYRLERVRELTGLDPASTEDRERLGLGLKALRIVEPDLPR
jgi:PucR family transcriptional regulator, purine catabolism regulatory protein